MNDDTAVSLAAGRVRRGNVTGALQLLTRQAGTESLPCLTCGDTGEVVWCANDGTHGCSHQFDQTWPCPDCGETA